MANNRLWLVHRPTGKGVQLGKRMGWGWYNAADNERLQRLFDYIEDLGGPLAEQDDFCLCIEDGTDAPTCDQGWVYGDVDENGLRNIKLNARASPS
jgi:hypothetical protein